MYKSSNEFVTMHKMASIEYTYCIYMYMYMYTVYLNEYIQLTLTMLDRSSANLSRNSSLTGSLVPWRIKSGR